MQLMQVKMSSPTRSLLLLLQADTTSATTLDDHGYAAEEGASANAEYNMFNPAQAYAEYPDAGMGGDVYDSGCEGYGFAADDDESSAYFAQQHEYALAGGDEEQHDHDEQDEYYYNQDDSAAQDYLHEEDDYEEDAEGAIPEDIG
jgi:hypothetical protein